MRQETNFNLRLVFLFLGINKSPRMQRKFSQNSIDKFIEYFWRKHGLVISQEEADEYLDRYADLFILLSSLRE